MTAKWTWLVYMAGDNNLESQGPIDLREMQRVGSNADVNIIVQFDAAKPSWCRLRRSQGPDGLPHVGDGDVPGRSLCGRGLEPRRWLGG